MKAIMLVLTLAALMAACGREEAGSSAPMPAPTDAAGGRMPEPPAAAPGAGSSPAPEARMAEQAAPTSEVMTTQRPATTAPAGVPSRDEGLALAQKGGCLACHKIDAKLVGPAWQDVSAKYQGNPDAMAQLVQKVKAGGQGNWTEVTGGIPMPPYSPRVSDADIERLVMFVLSL